MSYIVEFPPLQINANVFQDFCKDYLVVLKNISLCRMGDNDLYSKKKNTTLQINAQIFWNFL